MDPSFDPETNTVIATEDVVIDKMLPGQYRFGYPEDGESVKLAIRGYDDDRVLVIPMTHQDFEAFALAVTNAAFVAARLRSRRS